MAEQIRRAENVEQNPNIESLAEKVSAMNEIFANSKQKLASPKFGENHEEIENLNSTLAQLGQNVCNAMVSFQKIISSPSPIHRQEETIEKASASTQFSENNHTGKIWILLLLSKNPVNISHFNF